MTTTQELRVQTASIEHFARNASITLSTGHRTFEAVVVRVLDGGYRIADALRGAAVVEFRHEGQVRSARIARLVVENEL